MNGIYEHLICFGCVNRMSFHLSSASAGVHGNGMQQPSGSVLEKPDDQGPDLAEAPYDCTAVDHNQKLLLDLEFFEDGEACIAALSGYIGWKRGSSAEPSQPVPGLLVISNHALHVFTTSATDSSLSLLGKYDWGSVAQITVGVGQQCIHFATDGVLYTVWTGNDEMTWSFLQVLADDVKPLGDCRIEWIDTKHLVALAACIDEVEHPVHAGVDHVEASTISQMRAAYTIRSKLERYESQLEIKLCVVAQRRSPAAAAIAGAGAGGGAGAGTAGVDGGADTGMDGELYLLVLTTLEVYLIKREYASSGTQWTVASQHEITGVRALGYSPSAPEEATILLWNEDGVGESDPNGAVGSQWKLIFRSRGSIAKLAKTLNALWRPYFGIDMPWHRLVTPSDTLVGGGGGGGHLNTSSLSAAKSPLPTDQDWIGSYADPPF